LEHDEREGMSLDRSVVATARSQGYGPQEVRRAVGQCLDALPQLQRRLEKADSILLKPNLLSSTAPPDRHVNTHPAVVRALAEIVASDFRCRVAIGDSCGSLTRDSTASALQRSGMVSAAVAVGADLYNVDAQPRHTVHLPQGAIYRDMPLPANLSEFDLILPVAKLKTHNLTYMTCAVKNLLGLVPGAGKKKAHMLAPRAEEFAVLLADLFALIQPGAGLVDGVIGMEGRGPAHGRPRHIGLIAAATDCVALDGVCAQVMGLEPMDVPLLAECDRRGLGMAGPESVRVIGEPAAAFAPPDFRLPPAFFHSVALRAAPRWLFRRLLDGLYTVHSSIDQARCTRCGECARNCPSNAIAFDEEAGRYRVDRSLCISCYCCDEVCPSDAIRMRRKLPGRVLEGLSSLLSRGRAPSRR